MRTESVANSTETAGRRRGHREQRVREALGSADIEVNGSRPWDIQVFHQGFYRRILAGGSMALGESYLDRWWEVDRLDELFDRLLRAGLDTQRETFLSLGSLAPFLFNLQRRSFAFRNARPYDIGNDLYRAMLDSRMVYTCGYWKNAATLDEAQEAKLELVCRKLGLERGMRVLDIGCGWGSFARYAAERYGASVVGITVSKQQAEFGARMCSGLPVEIRLLDYRDVDGTYDRIVSLGMLEHVGWRNYRSYMQVVHEHLGDEGLCVIQTIGGNRSVKSIDPWIGRYIFPNAMLPSIAQIGRAVEGLFVMEDWQNFGADYDRTLVAWFANFDANWETLQERYGARFYRMWKYYLLACAGSFRARRNQVWQVVFSKTGLRHGYDAPR